MEPDPKKILIVQLRRVGDVLFTLPAAHAVKARFPRARVDFLTESPSDQLVRLDPHVDRTWTYEKDRPLFWLRKIRGERYDWVLDFHANGRTLLLTLLSGARIRAGFDGPLPRRIAFNRRTRSTDRKYLVEQKLDVLRDLGIPAGDWRWGLDIPDDKKRWAAELLAGLGVSASEKIAGIAPATRRPVRAWKNDRFGAVVRRLIEAGHPVLLLWGPGEKPWMEEILESAGLPAPLRGRALLPPETTLIQLAALIEKCSAVLAVDNGPKNLAVALDVPTATLSGPTNPLSFNPRNDPRHVLLRDDSLPCIACGSNSCPTRHECMENISADRAGEAVLSLLRTARTSPAPRTPKEKVSP